MSGQTSVWCLRRAWWARPWWRSCWRRLFLEKFGGDSLEETRRNYAGYQRQLKDF